MNAEDASLTVEAVTDTHGRQQAKLGSPIDEEGSPPEAPLSALREALDHSPVIGWLKDLDGRYLHVNRRYAIELNTSDVRLYGHTDSELPTRETVDGPRVQYTDDGLQEPLQLEYTIPAFESRPAFVALRFATRDLEGQPVGVCGVAAPMREAQLARQEAVRLMEIERSSWLDPAAVRAGPLAERGVGSAPAGARVVEQPGAPEEHRPPELDEAPTSVERAEADAAQSREMAKRAREELEALRSQVEELQRASDLTNIEHAPDPFAVPASPPSNAKPEVAGDLADRVRQLQEELEQIRAELEQARAEAHAARADLEEAQSEREQAREEREQARTEAERSRVAAAEARNAAIIAQGELEAARSGHAQATAELTDQLRDRDRQIESLHAPAALVNGLSADLQRALASERERGEELSRALDQLIEHLAEVDHVE